MPVNLIDIKKKLEAFSNQARAYHQRAASRLELLQARLETYGNRLDELKALVDREAQAKPHLRCAVPVDEPLNAAMPVGELPAPVTLLAADGSQINPSRHTGVPFCVINVGVVKMARGSGETPQVYTQSALLDYETVLPPSGGMLSEGAVGLKRDLREREVLLEVAAGLQPPAIAMVDGPLELIRDPQTTGGFDDFVRQYETILTGFREKELTLLGYIDKSQNDLIGRLMSLTPPEPDSVTASDKQARLDFSGVGDIHLMAALLQNPGDRSAIFAVYSRTALKFKPELRPYFFYLNVGFPGKPHLARVEVPAWVAEDKAEIALIQAALLDQARMLGSRPYPYLLHRAHEEALISLDEHQRVEAMIVARFLADGLDVGELSNKQYHKDLDMTKKRYQQ